MRSVTSINLIVNLFLISIYTFTWIFGFYFTHFYPDLLKSKVIKFDLNHILDYAVFFNLKTFF
jgi:hypothetical protein